MDPSFGITRPQLQQVDEQQRGGQDTHHECRDLILYLIVCSTRRSPSAFVACVAITRFRVPQYGSITVLRLITPS
jgi:hypothetical protein